MRKYVIILAFFSVFLANVHAQKCDSSAQWHLCISDSLKPLRPVTSSYMLAVGSGHLADTYLTPLHYKGQALGFFYERWQAMRFCPERWVMKLAIGAQADLTKNPVKTTKMYAASLQGSWSMMRRWQLPSSMAVGVGPGTALDLGALYIDRGGNNPASAKAAWTVDASAFASWSSRLWKVPFTLRYEARLPITGVFFSPDYGQLYYQIYLGDRENLVHAAWWGNYFRLDNLLSIDLHLGATSLRLGYKCDVFSSKASGIVSRDISHLFVLGVTTQWLSLPLSSRRLPSAPIISAY